jgi:hypothetical protein
MPQENRQLMPTFSHREKDPEALSWMTMFRMPVPAHLDVRKHFVQLFIRR